MRVETKRIQGACRVAATLATLGLFTGCDEHGHGHEHGPAASYALPGDEVFPESIAFDEASQRFVVGSLADGTVYAGHAENHEMIVAAEAPEGAGSATGMRMLPGGGFLVMGGETGTVRVYARDASLDRIARVPARFGREGAFLNDAVVLSSTEAYVTDSRVPVLYRFDPTSDEELEVWLDLSRTMIRYQDGFNLNGIVATESGRYLIAAQTNAKLFWRIDRETTAVRQVEVDGGEGGGDGVCLKGSRLYAVQGDGVGVYRLSPDASTLTFVQKVTDDRFAGPTAVALDGDDLLVVNGQLEARGGTPDLPFTVTRTSIPPLGD